MPRKFAAAKEDRVPTKTTRRILLFTADDDIEGYRRARALQAGLTKSGYDCSLVNKLGQELQDLMLVAQHRVVQIPAWIVCDRDGNEILRMLDMPSTAEARRTLEAICP